MTDGVLRDLAAAAAQVAVRDWSEPTNPGTDPVEAFAVLSQVAAQVEAAKVNLAAHLTVTGAAVEHGWASTKDFLTSVSGGPKGTGGALVRLAGRLEAMPATAQALAEGWLSRTKADTIAMLVTRLPRVQSLRADAEARLLELARTHDDTDLRGAFRAVVRELDPDGEILGTLLGLPKVEQNAHAQRFLSFRKDVFGGMWVRGYACVEDIERIKATLMPLAGPRPTKPGACGGTPTLIAPDGQRSPGQRGTCPDPECFHDGVDAREAGARLWDALMEVLDRANTADLLPTTHGTPTRLFVTTTLDDLRQDPGATDSETPGPGGDHDRDHRRDEGGTTLSGEALSVGTVRRMACDAEIIPAVLGSEGQLLDLGRVQRLVTTALWQALVLRDRHCAFPGCTRLPIACDAHHVQHWADGGPTSLDNMVLLCRRHHTLVHRSPWALSIDELTRRPVFHPPPGLKHTPAVADAAQPRPPNAA
ncbi:MAG: DUF222 domain-containing protein [Nocardioidaceae bacterium]